MVVELKAHGQVLFTRCADRSWSSSMMVVSIACGSAVAQISFALYNDLVFVSVMAAALLES